MWLFTTTGFFTVVNHNKQENTLIVRARVKKDLKDLKRDYMPELSKITFHLDYDYPYRSMISHEDFGKGMAKLVMDINYEKFKTEVGRRQGFARSSLYTSVWSKMIDVEVDKSRIKHYFNRGLSYFDRDRGSPRQQLYTTSTNGAIVPVNREFLDGDDGLHPLRGD
jgi:hypothetical protein